jgi:hypothetical protein
LELSRVRYLMLEKVECRPKQSRAASRRPGRSRTSASFPVELVCQGRQQELSVVEDGESLTYRMVRETASSSITRPIFVKATRTLATPMMAMKNPVMSEPLSAPPLNRSFYLGNFKVLSGPLGVSP